VCKISRLNSKRLLRKLQKMLGATLFCSTLYILWNAWLHILNSFYSESVMGSLETLPHHNAGHFLVSRQYFHYLGLEDYCLGLDPHCLGLALTVLVLCLETKTVQDTCWKVPPTYRLTSWQNTWQWSNVRTLTQMNSQPFILSLPQFHGLWAVFSRLWCVPVTSALVECIGRLTKWHPFVTTPDKNSECIYF